MTGSAYDPTPFRMERQRTASGIRTVTVSGEIDLATAPQLSAALADRDDGETGLVLDLRPTTFLDSSGIRVLVEAHRAGAADGIPFSVAGSPLVVDLLRTTGVADHLTLVDAPPAS